MRTDIFSQPIPDFESLRILKRKVLNWVRPFNTFCFLDNHQYQLEPHSEECLMGVGAIETISSENGASLAGLQRMLESGQYWMGHFNYELKLAGRPGLLQNRPDRIGFPEFHFFRPALIVRIREHDWTIEGEGAAAAARQILEQADTTRNSGNVVSDIKSRISRKEYIDTIHRLQEHIRRGDCYEINFCQEFFAEQANIDPIETYGRLADISPNPFAGLYRLGDRWLICASPERFLKKKGKRILSQPIKGTLRRQSGTRHEIEAQRQELYNSAKDRAENVMVVDLVRNDLARICSRGSVKVDELYGVYSFPQVHQMISTVSGELIPQASFSEILEATFPMGSMTGAPKHRVMELIEQYESDRRGIFSGALGYVDPKGDFDFNVVIRSILYQSATGYLSFFAGSGITAYSVPENEWEECQLKAAAIRESLGQIMPL
ncbi:MAG: anthranilate synthase component I family protein [Chitinophagaceae bacterium]